MSGHYPPLTCKDVKTILKNLGFEPSPQKGTSHEHWKLIKNGRLYKVTVDCPKQPFCGKLLSYMIQQSGVSKSDFYATLDK